MFSVSIALLACILGILNGAQGDTTLTSFTPNYGSLAGGTRLVIYGSGFGDMYTSTVLVYVGPYPCTIIMHYTTSEVLTCETSPGLAGAYFVYVSVDGAEPESLYAYTYSDYYTPTFKTVVPRAGPPGTRVTLIGDSTSNLRDRDCVENTWGEIDCLGSIIFGDYLCSVNPSDSASGISIAYGNPRYGYYQYLINCTLPSPEANNDQPAIGTAGKYNATIHFEASMRGASPNYLRSSYLYDVNGTAHHFQVYPEVSSITPPIGSTAGGTLVKVTGRGFMDLSLGLGGDVTIVIGGAPCAVVNSTYDTVFCVTEAQPLTPPSSSVPILGQFPAMRGIEYEFYNTTSTATPGFSDLWSLNKTVRINNTAGTGSYKKVLYDIMESRDYTVGYHCTRMKAFFIPPRTGLYSFYMTGDDYAQLNATWLQNGIEVTQSFINLTTWTTVDNYFIYGIQKSPAVNFTAGKQVLLESSHCNTLSYGMVQVAARMPVDKPQVNSMSEIQTVAVTSMLMPNSLAIKYMSGAGANTTAFTVTVVATNDSKLDEPRLGLELVFNTGSPVVVLPLAATGPEMTRLIESGFSNTSGLCSANNSFGVLKLRSTGVLTVQIGIDAALGSSLRFSVTLARVVNLPPAPTFTPTPCNISGVNLVPTPITTTPVPDAATDMYVLLEPTRPVPAANPSGYFQLRLATSSTPLVLSHDTNATVMASAIRNLTGYDVSVSLITKRREGAYFAHVWNVTFPMNSFNNAPVLVAEPVDSMPLGELIATETRPATPPVTGTFKLSFGDNCATVSIDVTSNKDTVRTKLAALPGMVAPMTVGVNGGPASGYTFTVTFNPIGTPGDQPQLRVVDTSSLQGVLPTVTITTTRNGSTDAFYAPLTAEFLQLAVPQPGSIALSVNGVPAACVHPSGVCGFTYSTAATPTITSVTPTSLEFSSTSSLPLTITGTLFDASSTVTVKVGSAACNITSLTATQIVCSVPDTAPAGIRLVTILVDGLGYAAGDAAVRLETLYVTGTAPSPAVVATVGMTAFNITGKGFDNINCGNNKLYIGGVQCGIMACGANFVTVLYPGNVSAGAPAASITAEVYEGATLIDQDTPTAPTVQITASAPAIQAVSPATMPGAGGLISVALSGATASNVASVYMVPQILSISNYSDVAKAYKGRISCGAVSSTDSGVSCNTPAMPNGRYHVLVVLSTGIQLLSSDTISFDLVITDVTPNLGSIGGGTLITITGSGFSQEASQNAVFLTVPVSTTFLNGLIQCLTVSVNTTHLTCRTQPHLAADADVDDPSAKNVVPVATDARAVTVVICDSSYNTSLLREYCSALPETPRARYAASGNSSCNFGYSTVLTPDIDDVLHNSYFAGDPITIPGSYMTDVAIVEFMLDGVVKGLGTDVSTLGNAAYCTTPDLPPGVYTLRLKKSNGEMSVNFRGRGTYTYAASVLGLSGNVGSLVGGLPMTINVGGAGLAVGNDSSTANQVTIAGFPCPNMAVHNRTHLTCRAPSISGYALAEYWNLPVNTYSMPDIINFTDPVVARVERSTTFNWYANSPVPGTIQPDYWALRLTFYYQIAETENVTFRVQSDDESRLYIDDVYLGAAVYGQTMGVPVVLDPGVHKIVLALVQYTGYAYITISAAFMQPNGTLSNFAALEPRKVTPYAPGVPLPIDVDVNGVASIQLCPKTNYTLPLPSQPNLSFEPSAITVPNTSCSYIYTTYRTPSLVVVRGNKDGVTSLSGVTPPNFAVPNTTLSVYGNFLLNPDLPAADQVSVTIANQTCVVTSVAPFTQNYTVNSTVVTVVSGTNVTLIVSNTTFINVTRINCTLPGLPTGTWSVNINVAGLGLARPVASVSSELPAVTYMLRVNSYISPTLSGSSQCQLSVFGGGTFTVSGYGMVKNVVNSDFQRYMTAGWDNYTCVNGFCNPCASGAVSQNSPTCIAALDSRLKITPVASDGMTSSFRLTRIAVSNPSAYAGANNATNVQMFYKIRSYYNYTNNPQYETMASIGSLFFCGGRTPALSNVSPSSVAPDSGAGGSATLSLTWMLSGVGSLNNTITSTQVGAISNATVEFEVGPTVLACANATVTASAISATSYTESVTCKLPVYLPAANYTLWLCIQPFGCGLVPAYQVPLTVSSISANVGSSAGGIILTIAGKGFNTNSSLVAARFGNSTCKVTNSTATSVTCITGSLDTKPVSPVTWALSVTATVGASETTYPALTFTFDPLLESTVSSISPPRGSTEGGTPVTITGASFATGVSTSVTIGDTPCTSVVVVNSTAITCTTGKPPVNVLRVPLPVSIFQEGRGSPRGSLVYQYIDLWSRNSTWGGGPLPGYEDSVVIPSGVTVLLDMSPPKLFVLVLEGNLEFDDTQPYINLQAHYIIVKGGNFSIGKPGKPFPGRANITMHGPPNSRDLPLYGAKSLAVRDGVVTFVGQPKVPTYTTLNQTVDPGATEIIINGAVNWQVGDFIAIASSSFYPSETHEATIVAIDSTRRPGCTVLTLDKPTTYTHLGEIHSQAGVAAPLDMRTEVAVLTRNIVVMGDWTSRRNMYGVQVMVNSPRYLPRALVRFDNIEITQSGQAFRLGRYSMHWHMHGDVAYQSWVRGCAIHHTYNRAITIHGTHRAIIQNTVAYGAMGHTFFLEDGIESGNLIEGNLAFNTKASDALLNTDTTPASYWITNPNNTVRNNRAGGSMGYGYWYRLLDNPEGPSYTTTVCPKFTPLLEYTNNTAHSNMFYGLRIHPEFYPRLNPCNGFTGTFQQVPAVFNGLVSYKNGMKGFVSTQVGLVQVANMVIGDNGGGPRAHLINGKDHGGQAEMSWVTDDRNQVNVKPTEMAGFVNATIYSRTSTGRSGSAGAWPSCRRVAGVITQSPVLGHSKHSALMSMINITFVNWMPGTDSCTLYTALEACGKCKTFQGGSTTFTAGIKFVNADGSKPQLSLWSWGHQGIFLDTDGTLLNPNTIPAELLPPAGANWTFGPGATWHSAVMSNIFDPAECVYVRNSTTSNNGAYCSPALLFRRVMLNNHNPQALEFKDLWLVALAANRTSVVPFTKYNEMGYQFTVATGRDYWVQWDMKYRLDPETFTLHKMDLGNMSHHTYISSKYVQRKNHFKVNYQKVNLTSLPLPLASTPHGANYYNKNFTPNSWWWGNNTYNDTKFTIYLDGRSDGTLNVAAFDCPDEGCNNLPEDVVDIRNGTLYWSNASTWNTSITNYTKPVAGDNVTIPYGWNLVIDESTPALNALIIQGTVRFDATRNINLTATYILVMYQGVLNAGSPDAPHPTTATILLSGGRATPDFAIDNKLNLGSAVLAALQGGTIQLYGRQVNRRWTRLASAASVNDTSITVSDPTHGWRVGDRILITATSYNMRQTEFRTIVGIRNNGSQLVLDSPLEKRHGAVLKAYENGPVIDMRAEVGLVSSNVLIRSAIGRSSYANGSELFGARVVVSGTGVGLFSGIAMEYCGQAGLTDRACILFDRIDQNSTGNSTGNPSRLDNSAIVYGMNGNIRINGLETDMYGVNITNNVMYESYEAHAVHVTSSNNFILGNLVLGTIKDMEGKSGFDITMPSSFYVTANNYVEDNVAAGSDRYGFSYMGVPCGTEFMTGSFRNNSAHSCLAGLWLQHSVASQVSGCTLLKNFTTYMNWDFGVISTNGIITDVRMEDVNILDNKHAGIHLMRKSDFLTTKAWITWTGGLLAGQSNNDVCNVCATLGDDGCHKKLSVQSYNLNAFSPAFGMVASQFALGFAVGPEKKPWDKPMGYSIVHGKVNVSGVTIADFLGPSGCGGASVGTYALANHQKAPEAFFPHFFSQMNVVNVAKGTGQGMFYHVAPDPEWRNENDCGEAVYTREDGTVIPLNCAGPAHVHWRDLDGTLTGTVGVTAGVFINTPRVFPMDQGTPVLPGPCTYSSVIDSYSCAAGSSSFLLDARLKPNPIPADGIFGDPQHFVLESRDKDSEDRNFGPVFFNVSGSIDLVTTAMDHGWCFAYTCQKRLSTFWTYLPSGQTVYINFTGTPSSNFRYWFPYADPNKEIVLVINMLYTLNRRFMWLPSGMVTGRSGRVSPQPKPVAIGDGTDHGDYYWDQDNTLLYVKMKGGKTVESRAESAVMISQSFAISIDNFYSMQSKFISNLAAVMGIDANRIFIAKVVPGTVTAQIGIGPNQNIPVDALPELSVSVGSDGTTTTASPPPPPSTSDSDASAASVLFQDLSDAYDRFVAAVTSPEALNDLGVQPVGTSTVDWGTIPIPSPPPPWPPGQVPPSPPPPTRPPPPWPPGQVPPSPPPSPPLPSPAVISGNPNVHPETTPGTVPASHLPPTTSPPPPWPPGQVPPSPPPSPPPPSPAVISGNSNVAPEVTPTGSTPSAPNADDGLNVTLLAGVIAGVVGGCILAALIAAYVMSRQRRQRTLPVDRTNQLNVAPVSSDLMSPASTRQAFVTALPPSAPASPPPPPKMQPAGPVQESAPADELASPRTASTLAAGLSPVSQPVMLQAILGPLQTDERAPHTAVPLVMKAAPAPLGPLDDAPKVSLSGSDRSNRLTKAPAELQIAEANTGAPVMSSCRSSDARPMNYTPNAVMDGDWANTDTSETVKLSEQVGPVAGTPRVAAASAPAGEGGTPVEAMKRGLDTAESFIPRTRSRTHTEHPGDGAAAPHTAGSVHMAAEAGGAASQGALLVPPLPRNSHGALGAVQPSVQLPGGFEELKAATMARSNAAALMIAAGDSVEEKEPEGSQAEGQAVARTPAGLHSDSMRRREADNLE